MLDIAIYLLKQDAQMSVSALFRASLSRASSPFKTSCLALNLDQHLKIMGIGAKSLSALTALGTSRMVPSFTLVFILRPNMRG